VISGTTKPRKLLTMSQFLLGHNVQTHNNSLRNLVRGVGERVLYTNSKQDLPISPVKDVFEGRLSKYREQLVSSIGYQSPVTYDKFVSYYKGPRKTIYQKAVDSLMFTSIRRRDAYLSTFVKAEKLNFDIKPDPVPRVIQPRNPRFNVEVGRFLRPLEERMYKELDNLFGAPTIMSPYNAFTQAKHLKAKWDTFCDPVCIGLDASRFDQHVSKQALLFEHSIYNQIYRNGRLKNLLNMQINNVGYAKASDGWFKYLKTGSRMSGDMNTSMGNKILMCLMSLAYLDTKSFKCSFINNGDDCLIFTERKYLKQLDDLEKYFVDFGFNIKREKPVFEFEEVEFCQTKPIKSNGIWRMVRNVKTCLTKDVTSLSLGHNIVEYRRCLRDIGNCGLATAADVPVLGSFYAMLVRFGLDGDYTRKWDADNNYYRRSSVNAKCDHNEPDQYGRYSFWKSTGITPDAQIALEGYFDDSIWGATNRQVCEFNFNPLFFNA
jgi:hypothetical protein